MQTSFYIFSFIILLEAQDNKSKNKNKAKPIFKKCLIYKKFDNMINKNIL